MNDQISNPGVSKSPIFTVSEGPKMYDGEYEIVFDGSFNLYDNVLRIGQLYNYMFEFFFDPNMNTKDPGKIEVNVDENNEITRVSLTKFRNQLGAYTTVKQKVLTFGDGTGKSLYVSIYGKSVDPTADFLHLSINFYIK